MADDRRTLALVGVAALAVLAFLYSLLVAATPLLGVTTAVLLALVYLVWRFVRAHERIADALAARADAGSDERA